MAIRATNNIAADILNHLPGQYNAEGGYFGGGTYCIGVRVKDAADAFNLGADLGAEVEFLGEVGMDTVGPQTYIVFHSALVTQAG